MYFKPVDGTNLAPVDMENLALLTASQVASFPTGTQ